MTQIDIEAMRALHKSASEYNPVNDDAQLLFMHTAVEQWPAILDELEAARAEIVRLKDDMARISGVLTCSQHYVLYDIFKNIPNVTTPKDDTTTG